ncbi:MAG: hypothetical protein ACREOZ_01545 [Gloeomargaritales cyanobacterium]
MLQHPSIVLPEGAIGLRAEEARKKQLQRESLKGVTDLINEKCGHHSVGGAIPDVLQSFAEVRDRTRCDLHDSVGKAIPDTLQSLAEVRDRMKAERNECLPVDRKAKNARGWQLDEKSKSGRSCNVLRPKE